ncbi:MAG TPA: alpha-L-glutamate ligase-like protein [Hyphomonas sp.]|nr:alpha-L-glutamate ligase-like protein [Hyphomonas sp.]MCB9972582.1 alpha-L-glutamate ligase-like protein [Hyphomonas sp.]HPE46835.1 alpha-L-glutamate ligase-like protein [Hyphomonas sp.]
MIRTWLALRRAGVLGINERNLRLINDFNPRKLMRLVDDKTQTKSLANAAGIQTPELYGIIRAPSEMRKLEKLLDHPDGCVIKPANGSQGNGIQVLLGPMRGGWRRSNGQRALLEDLKFHVNNILSGMYSLAGLPDFAMIEYRVKFDDVFDPISFGGVPDIRIIVLRGIPFVAMVRLPTAESDGKANLHKGGVGVGLDLVTGRTKHGMQNGKITDIHPDTANPLANVSVPHWDDMLLMAAKAYDVTGLGYLGADIVLDKGKGPMLLELNARPGLAIQVANRMGIRPLMEAALVADTEGLDAEGRVALAKTLYRRFVPEPAPA